MVISILKAVLVLLSRTIVLDHTKIQRILVFKYNISFSLWIQSFSANLSNKKDGAPRLPMQPLCYKKRVCEGGLIMIFKKNNYPENNELIVCTVKKVLPHSVFCNLDEYNHEGMIHISEVAPGRIRNMPDFF